MQNGNQIMKRRIPEEFYFDNIQSKRIKCHDSKRKKKSNYKKYKILEECENTYKNEINFKQDREGLFGNDKSGIVVCNERKTGEDYESIPKNNSPDTKLRRPKKINLPKLYRLLRDGEDISIGLTAKDPKANENVALHVARGSGRGTFSQYISTCSSYRAADVLLQLKLKSRFKHGMKDIVEIDVDTLPDDVRIIDLRTEKSRKQYDTGNIETDSKFHRFASSHEEVLLVGKVPLSCLNIMKFIGTDIDLSTVSVKLPKLYRLLRDGEDITHGLPAKNPKAEDTVAVHVARGSNKDNSSQYISTCSSYRAATAFLEQKLESGFNNGMKDIAEIDVYSLPYDVKIIDLRSEMSRKQYETGNKKTDFNFHRNADRFQAVLLVGSIPSSCLSIIKYKGILSDDSYYPDSDPFNGKDITSFETFG